MCGLAGTHQLGQGLEFPVRHAAEEFPETGLLCREQCRQLEVAATERQRYRLRAVGLGLAEPPVGMHERSFRD